MLLSSFVSVSEILNKSGFFTSAKSVCNVGADSQLEALLFERDQLLTDFSDLAETGALAV